jgi:hypothetical protein
VASPVLLLGFLFERSMVIELGTPHARYQPDAARLFGTNKLLGLQFEVFIIVGDVGVFLSIRFRHSSAKGSISSSYNSLLIGFFMNLGWRESIN